MSQVPTKVIRNVPMINNPQTYQENMDTSGCIDIPPFLWVPKEQKENSKCIKHLNKEFVKEFF